jgi:hypothetical protein
LSNGTANNDGTYVKVKATLAVTSLSGNNPIAVAKVEYRKRGVETWTLGTNAFVNDTYSVVGGNNITTPEAYEIRILLQDTVGKSATHTLIISPSSRLYDFRTDRASIGRIAGTVAKTFILPDDWTTNVDADKLDGYDASNATGSIPISNGTVNTDLNADKLDGNHASAFAAASHEHSATDITSNTLPVARGGTGVTTTKAIALLSYPVGAIYMSTVSTSPATLFGGTWEALGGRMLIGVNGTYAAGATGGAATHTLTKAELPSYDLDIYAGSYKLYYLQTTAAGGNGVGGLGTGGSAFNAKSGGSGAAHNNMPPYLAVYMWERTA